MFGCCQGNISQQQAEHTCMQARNSSWIDPSVRVDVMMWLSGRDKTQLGKGRGRGERSVREWMEHMSE